MSIHIPLFALFCTAVNAAPIPRLLTATIGGNVTVWRGLNDQTQALLSSEPDNSILLHFNDGSIVRKNSNICVENGAIVITNVQKKDSNIYKLQIYRHKEGQTYNITFNVTEPLHQASAVTSAPPTQSPNIKDKTTKGHDLAVIIGSIAAVVVVVVVAVIAYWKRKWLWDKISTKTFDQREGDGPL